MGRWFQPSKSDNQSGAEYNAAYNAAQLPAAPTQDTADADAAAEMLKKRRRLTKTILSEGMADDFEKGKKTLLGS
jgi:hypothetical protein